MLLNLAAWLQGVMPEWGFLRIFQYITFRAVMAAMTALLIGIAFGPWVIRRLTELKIGQPVRTYAMQTHLAKNGTPTMGGVLVLLAIAVATLLWFDLSNRFVWIVLLVTFGFGAIGWVDDWRKVVRKDPEGMRSREKFMWQTLVGLLAVLLLAFSLLGNSTQEAWALFTQWVAAGLPLDFAPENAARLTLLVPFFKEIGYPAGLLGFVALSFCVIVGSSNAVNFTDGLDGLAAGLVAVGAGAFFAYSYVLAYEQDLARATTASLLTVATLGICLGFLGHNFQPAHMFMGDAGAMLLGFLMAMSAISFTGQVDPSALSRDHDDVLPALLPVLLPFATMALPLSDLVLAWIRRTARGQHPFKADKHHLHHRLVARGHSQRGVVFIMCSWGAVIAGGLVCTVLLNHPATWWAIGVFLVLLVLVTIMPVRRGTGTAKHG